MALALGVVDFIFWAINQGLNLLWLAIIASAILSWLFAFDVINYRNRFVYQLAQVLDRLTSPILAPLQRIIPPLGGMDLTPIVALLAIRGVQIFLLPPIHAMCRGLLL